MTTNEVAVQTAENNTLTKVEADRLRRCEDRIRQNIRGFAEVGVALAEIRDARLYRVDWKTFEEYVKDRWQFGRAHAYRLIDAAETVKVLSPQGDIPPTIGEKHLRPLLQFPTESRPAVWERVKKARGESPTAAEVEKEIKILVANSDQEPFQSVRRERKRIQRERQQKANEERDRRHPKRSSAPKLPAFDLTERSQIVAERIDFWLSEWPAEHHHTLAELLRREANDIEVQRLAERAQAGDDDQHGGENK